MKNYTSIAVIAVGLVILVGIYQFSPSSPNLSEPDTVVLEATTYSSYSSEPAPIAHTEFIPTSSFSSANASSRSVVEAEAALPVTPEEARLAVFNKENAVYEKATALFDAEAVDVEWAAGYEQSLRSMFSSHWGLQRVSVNSILCHTTQCRIEVFTPQDRDADFFTAMFYNALDEYDNGSLKAEASITRRMQQGITSVYIARQGHVPGFY
jgi:hypothetical protein